MTSKVKSQLILLIVPTHVTAVDSNLYMSAVLQYLINWLMKQENSNEPVGIYTIDPCWYTAIEMEI